jgi:ABC-type phosphate transport system auxiliary subunit
VLTGIDNVDVTADIRGTTASPTLAVRSNLDRAVADNIKRVAGEEIAKAEARVRAQVDVVVQRETAALKAKIDQAVADTKEQVDQRIAEAQTRLDKAKADLAARLKELGGGIIGG